MRLNIDNDIPIKRKYQCKSCKWIAIRYSQDICKHCQASMELFVGDMKKKRLMKAKQEFMECYKDEI